LILKKVGRDVASISSTNIGNQAQNRIEYPSPWESRALTRAPGLFYLLSRLINQNLIHRQTQKVERELWARARPLSDESRSAGRCRLAQ